MIPALEGRSWTDLDAQFVEAFPSILGYPREPSAHHAHCEVNARRCGFAPPRRQPGARVVIEHDRRGVPPEELGALRRTDQRRYGDTLVSFFEAPA